MVVRRERTQGCDRAEEIHRVTYVLGVDVGSQSVKGVLLDGDGALRASASYALTMKHPRGGWAEQDPRHWEEGLASVIAGTLAGARVAAREVTALCLACQVDGVVPISASGEALGPAIIWLDRRAEDQVNDLAETFGAERLFELTGLVPDSSHSGPKIMWLRDHEPDVVRRRGRVSSGRRVSGDATHRSAHYRSRQRFVKFALRPTRSSVVG